MESALYRSMALLLEHLDSLIADGKGDGPEANQIRAAWEFLDQGLCENERARLDYLTCTRQLRRVPQGPRAPLVIEGVVMRLETVTSEYYGSHPERDGDGDREYDVLVPAGQTPPRMSHGSYSRTIERGDGCYILDEEGLMPAAFYNDHML